MIKKSSAILGCWRKERWGSFPIVERRHPNERASSPLRSWPPALAWLSEPNYKNPTIMRNIRKPFKCIYLMVSSDAGGRKDGEAFPSLSGSATANGHPLLRDHVLASAAVSASPAAAAEPTNYISVDVVMGLEP